jgi:2-polyprenyl-3-methyl-5-hydroxy-6-metoxy-1,4-benzoquinol methylase
MLKNWIKVLKKIIKNPKEIIKYSKILLKIIIIKVFHKNDQKIINDWERFDPLLTTWYIDKSHLPRYNFAKKFLSKDDTVIDIASWTWYWTELLSLNCKSIIWVDISIDAVEYATNKRKWENLIFVNNDLYKNKLTANVIISFETIEHIPNKSIEETIAKLISYWDRLIIWSYPYKEKKWNNKHHFQFNLDENNLSTFVKQYKIDIYYQDIEWNISTKINSKEIQNLVFVLQK